MNKVRKQIYLNPWQEERLSELATKSGASEAQIIRQAIDAYLIATDELPPDHPLSFLAGMGSSTQDGGGAAEHDRTIYQC